MTIYVDDSSKKVILKKNHCKQKFYLFFRIDKKFALGPLTKKCNVIPANMGTGICNWTNVNVEDIVT